MNGTIEGPHTGSSSVLVLWRIVAAIPATLDDFRSHKERGIPLRRPTPDALRLWEGVSVYRKREVAKALARSLPHLGGFVAAFGVPLDGTIILELDNRRNGHCTMWAAPEILARLVISVESI